MNMRASEASELKFFWHFLNLKLLFPSLFCWYTSDTFSHKHLFSGLKITSAYIKTINALSLYHLWYDAIYKRQYRPTDKTLIRASGASELKIFRIFTFYNTAISLNILLVLQILCFRKIFNFRCQLSPYIYNQCSFLLLLMVWCYINDSIPTKH